MVSEDQREAEARIYNMERGVAGVPQVESGRHLQQRVV